MTLLSTATSSLDIASYYWTLIGRGDIKDVTDKEVLLFGKNIYLVLTVPFADREERYSTS